MAARRRLGQHYLFDPNILGRIADALGAPAGARVLEIGPGPGGLTEVLRDRDVRLTTIERDAHLAQALRERWPDLEVIEGNALEVDWPAAVGRTADEAWYVIGNIPYNITTPLIDKALYPPWPTRIVFLVQQEVADRLTAGPGTKAYGGLTVGVATVASVERLFRVPAGAFRPPPRVASTVVRLVPLAEPLVAPSDRAEFRRLVAGLFSARRKQLARAIRTAFGFDPVVAGRICAAANVDPRVRCEALTPRDFARLHRQVVDGGWRAA